MAMRLSKRQLCFLEAASKRKNVFLTGSAGCGKTACLNFLMDAVKGKNQYALDEAGLKFELKDFYERNVVVTASTGTAAILLKGQTIHSWAGIGLGKDDPEKLIAKIMRNKEAKQRWREADVLIIDEISMIHGLLFDKLNYVGQGVRENKSPFGGIQIIACGDFAQIPPVVTDKDEIPDDYINRKYAFMAKTWKSCFPEEIYLNKNFRQNDQALQDYLREIRYGRVPPEFIEAIAAQTGKTNEDSSPKQERLIKLFAKNQDVDRVNNLHLDKISGDLHTFRATDEAKSITYLNQIKKGSRFPFELRLKIGARVMLLKNLNVKDELVNGSQGIVTSVDSENDCIQVKFHESSTAQKVMIHKEKETIEYNGQEMAHRNQFPLRLAYAITMHKSQGITCPRVEVDLRGCFAPGQAYTSLSRAVNMENLRVVNFSKNCVKADPAVVAFYENLTCKQIGYDLMKQDLGNYISDDVLDEANQENEISCSNDIFEEAKVKEGKSFDSSSLLKKTGMKRGRDALISETEVTESQPKKSFFEGKKLVLTGDLDDYTKAEFRDLIKQKGGLMLSQVSAKVDFLVVGDSVRNPFARSSDVTKTKKYSDATEKGVSMLSSTAFRDILGLEELS